MKLVSVIFGLAYLVLVGTGCANTRLSHTPGLITTWDRHSLQAKAEAPELALALYNRALSFGEPSGSQFGKWWSKRKIRTRLEKVLQEFPFLEHMQWEEDVDENTEYRLVIEATHAIRGSRFGNSVSQVSRYIIPSVQKAFVELDAWVYRDIQHLKTYEAIGSYKIKRINSARLTRASG